ncbi:MAG: AmmeMemoRadiSam system radical SAM enzyme [Bacteroidales bacterium]|nr:AmmeMemoRadiSam system radical SAM enzyme [Bacteroidales bacterium]
MKEALFYSRENNAVRCHLCPHNCLIAEGKRGICRVRKNVNGKLIAETFGQVSAIHFDPIEKKPLYHFFPGTTILSVGSIGCNLQCRYCQNWEISQSNCDDFGFEQQIAPDGIISKARSHPGNIGIAYTYNEPAIWFEFMLEIAHKAKEERLKNVMVTNGFINPDALRKTFEFIDAYSVDLKAFNEAFFKNLTHSRLQPVLEALKLIRISGKHLEVTNLIISNQNDDSDEFSRMVNWIAENLGKETVLHISRYFPSFKLHDPPTSEAVMHRFYELAKEKLQYVYTGNMRTPMGQDTFCPDCGSVTITRRGYHTELKGVDASGNCRSCGFTIIHQQNIN